jgi:hypothetical protein
MSWIDYHKEYEEELQNIDPDEGSDSEDLSLSHFWSGRKFPSYPRAEILNEAFDTAQTDPSNRSSSINPSELQGLTIQEPQVCFLTLSCSNVLADQAIDPH